VTYDINFHFDPICPFAWLTSKWVRQVASQRDYSVDWRFISLRVLNKSVDYDTHFPSGYEEGHSRGLHLLRVCAKARADHGPEAVARLYPAISGSMFDVDKPDDPSAHQRKFSTPEHLSACLEAADLPVSLAEAFGDPSWDEEIAQETEDVLALTGRDVGTPIIQFQPPEGVAFFGPVISRLPSDEQALELWDHVIGLANFGGFAELKRSLREVPQLRVLGVTEADIGKQQDWHGGSRKLKK